MDYPIPDSVHAIQRAAIESLYTGTLTATRTEYVTDPETGFEKVEKVVIVENEPCRVTRQLSNPTEGYPKEYFETVHVTLAPEVIIPPGSELDIDFHDEHMHFKQTSSVRRFTSHQTIEMFIIGEERNYS